MHWLLAVVGVIFLGAAFWVMLPAPIDPVAWTPDPAIGKTNEGLFFAYSVALGPSDEVAL
ncbi:MAG: hypothetical protein V7700_04210 [Halioglobus sp.]